MNIRYYRKAKMRKPKWHLVSYQFGDGIKSGFGHSELKLIGRPNIKSIKSSIEEAYPDLGTVIILNVIRIQSTINRGE